MIYDMFYDIFDSPVGDIIVVQDQQGLRYVDFQDGPSPLAIAPHWQRDPHPCQAAKRQLTQYFAGNRQQFDLPIAPQGTDFQQRVWALLAQIPYGELATYGQMANRLQQPSASRAVGMANGRNPIAIILPCHRVVGSSRKLTGYRGGLAIKETLLKLEGIKITDQTVVEPC
ncbi:MAG: methylated-DNA--[protein]-cysteine S-methyltransferase [Candidatus Pelagadaptatus aseana]|uniref:methylated-DNA--[protein]-cysteine S-methyltransferase n=1 Tax=Candidatus Pelagadaptatus aseana TaxID=3120508 RepID=UPI0039B1487C